MAHNADFFGVNMANILFAFVAYDCSVFVVPLSAAQVAQRLRGPRGLGDVVG